MVVVLAAGEDASATISWNSRSLRQENCSGIFQADRRRHFQIT